MTNLNVEIVLALLEKRNILKVWVAIFNRGISKPLFRPSKSEAVDSDIYINEYVNIAQTQIIFSDLIQYLVIILKTQ